MYKIKTLNSISEIGLKALDASKYVHGGDVENPDAILVRSADMLAMDFGPELLCVARAGAGTNNIPSADLAERGVVVFNTPGANAEAVAELVICAMLIASRDVVGGVNWVKTIADKGDEVAKLVEKGKSQFVGPELFGKTLGVIGLGAVGAKAANAAVALGMRVFGYDPYLSVDAAWQLSASVIKAPDLDSIYASCDYITLHVPYLDSTKQMINSASIAKMKDGVRVINLARGELVCDADIIAAIGQGKVSRYVTDFPDGLTAPANGVIAIPHLGASTPESEDNCATMAALQLQDYVENGNIANSVNMPSAYMPRTTDARVCVIHRNVPDMIARITGAVSSFGINIDNMVNASAKSRVHAYTMLDVDSVAAGLSEKIETIDGVIRVRTINS